MKMMIKWDQIRANGLSPPPTPQVKAEQQHHRVRKGDEDESRLRKKIFSLLCAVATHILRDKVKKYVNFTHK